ncbi:MAG: CDP-alcohol phosphatidyltransferase, partial [Promethearchaeota archaeon]
GGILDIFCDRTVEISIIIAIVSTDTINLIYPGLFSLASIILCISMFLLVGSLSERGNDANKSKVIKYRKGLIERSETYLFLLAITILFFWRVLLLWIFTILIFITALLRLRDAYILFQN